MITRVGRRPLRRTAGFAAACAGALLLLTACIDVNADVAVNSDATASGTFNLVLQKQAASMLGVTSADQWASQVAKDESGPMAGMGECKASETDAGYAYSCSFTNAAFTGSDAPWTITKNGDELTFTLTGNDAALGAEASPAPSESASDDLSSLLGGGSLGTITINVSFPGPITAMTGAGVTKTSDTSATITGDLAKAPNVTITANAGGGGLSMSMILVLLVALAVIALIAIVAVVLISRRKSPAGPALPATAAAPTIAPVDPPQAAPPAAPQAAPPAAPQAAPPAAPPADQADEGGTTPPA